MSSIVTFLGTDSTDRTTVAIATAKKLANEGSRVLLVGLQSRPAFRLLLGMTAAAEPVEIAANLSVVELSAATLLENSWEEVKKIEAQYLRSPLLKEVYGQELGVLPGMDEALALNAIREYDQSGSYDAIVYDGTGDINTLRMFGMPEILSWYIRRFRGIFVESDIVKALSPFVQPVSTAVLNVTWSAEDISETNNPASQILTKGTKALAEQRVIAYLVTKDDEIAITSAKYLWGSAQQIGLTVAGVLLSGGETTEIISSEFKPLTVTSLPEFDGSNWQPLIEGLPTKIESGDAPQPTTISTAEKKIAVFLPGFAKKEVKLTQYGPGITIEAGDQRRNIILPPAWQGRSVTGAKFQNGYLEVTIG
ncbi:Get3/ArsA fold putative tail anchor-mediating ATPase NosAFP [Myxosarcina sp. GI1(2024)]